MILLNRPQQGGDWVCAWPLGRCVKSAEGSYRRGRFRQRSLLPARAENIGRNDRDFLRKEADAGPEDGDRGDKVQRAVMPVNYRYRRDGEEFAEFWKRVTPVL